MSWKETVTKIKSWKESIKDEKDRNVDVKSLISSLLTQIKDGRNGVDGKDGLKGDKGDKGDKGQKGDRGSDGRDGINGSNGLDGERGARGEQGLKGEQGLAGKNGTNGIDGAKGDTGLDGSQWHLFKDQPNEKVGALNDFALCIINSNYYRREPHGDRLIWKFKGCLKGKDGAQGERGFNGSQGAKGIDGVGGGGGSYSATAKDTNYTIVAETFIRAFGNVALTFTLPDATVYTGELTVKQTSTQILTIIPNPAQALVNGVASIELPALDVGGFGYGNLGSSVKLSPQGGQFWAN